MKISPVTFSILVVSLFAVGILPMPRVIAQHERVSGIAWLDVSIHRLELREERPYVEARHLYLVADLYTQYRIDGAMISSGDGHQFEPRWSENITDNPNMQIWRFLLDSPPEQGALSPKWRLTRKGDFQYQLSFLLGFRTAVNLTQQFVHLSMDRDLEIEWIWKSSTRPFPNASKQYIENLGLEYSSYAESLERGYSTFYLFSIDFLRPITFTWRYQFTMTVPAVLILVILIASLILMLLRGLTLSNAFTLYLGTAFFALAFVWNFQQIASGSMTISEMILYFDIIFAIFLAILAVLSRLGGIKDGVPIAPALRMLLSRIRKKGFRGFFP